MDWKATVFITMCILAIAFPIVYYIAFNLPANIAFAKKFGARYEMALDQADFTQMRDGIMQIWNNMNDTWRGENYDEIYNTWWYGDQTYVNSMAAQNSYFNGLILRLNQTIVEKELILNGSKQIMIPYSTWEQQTIQNFRNETQRAGGLLWVIEDAWYMRYAPMVAFWPFYCLPIEAILLIIAIAIVLTA